MGGIAIRLKTNRYLLNSAVITAPGLYSYKLITPQEAKLWYHAGEKPISTIGYPETAEALTQLLELPEEEKIEVNRITIQMLPGDEALVFRLVLPPGTPRISPQDKGQILKHVKEGHWELGLLKRLE